LDAAQAPRGHIGAGAPKRSQRRPRTIGGPGRLATSTTRARQASSPHWRFASQAICRRTGNVWALSPRLRLVVACGHRRRKAPAECGFHGPANRHAIEPVERGECRRTICLIDTPSLARAPIAAFVSSRRRLLSYCSFSAFVSSAGLIVIAPIAPRIAGVDLHAASRKAELAFSVRCQRSGTSIEAARMVLILQRKHR